MMSREGAIDRERRDLVTRQVMDESCLIRFVAGPDGSVVPDLARKLPGRGLWVAADRASVETAAAKGLFARAAKAPLKAAPDLADMVERLLTRRCLEQLGLARREGVLISGFEKSAAAIRSGRAAWLIEASDGSADGRGKLLALARHQATRACGAFTAEDLSLALGLENAIHAVLLTGGRADRWTLEVERLAGFRPLRPPEWGRDATEGSDRDLDGRGSAP
ncbi:RNA-binding protein [Brevundimonas sp.]|uniref:RNA-binding protein n=1 Tax=Brevundimonas sp. TaxID=1871086 RepID=UPI002FDA9E15